MLLAAVIACIGGVAVGTSSAPVPAAQGVLAGVLRAIALPLIVLYPVVVAWTGIGPISKVIYAAARRILPIALATCPAFAPSIFATRSLRGRWAQRAGRS